MKKLMISLIMAAGLAIPATLGADDTAKVLDMMQLSYRVGCLKSLAVLVEAEKIEVKMSNDEVNGFCAATSEDFIKEFIDELSKGN